MEKNVRSDLRVPARVKGNKVAVRPTMWHGVGDSGTGEKTGARYGDGIV